MVGSAPAEDGRVRSPGSHDGRDEDIRLAQEKIRDKNERLKKLRRRLEEKEREISALRASRRCAGGVSGEEPGVRPENLVWIFGNARSGTTWLASMMESLEGHLLWHEPLVGELFGNLSYVRGSDGHRRSKHFIMGSHRETWLRSIRSFVLDGATARFPGVVGRRW